MHLSYWEKQDLYNNHQIVIIGSGIVGLTSAIYIKDIEPDIPVLILERGRLPSGASTKNAGFACFGSVSEILEDLQHMSRDEVVALIGSRYNGLRRLLDLTSIDAIEYEGNGGYELFTDDQEDLYDECLQKIPACCTMVEEATGLKNAYRESPSPTWSNSNKRLIFNPYEGQLNPMKLFQSLTQIAISKGVRILGATDVVEIQHDNHILVDANGLIIPYKKLLICTNGFASRLIDSLQVHAVRNQVLMTKPINGLSIKGCYHYNKGYVYFRDYGGRILLGGGRNISMDEETTDEFGLTTKIQEYLLSFLNGVIGISKKVEVDHWWSGILGVGSTKKTIIEEHIEDLFLGVRMGGMGVALGSEVGYELANMVVMK